MVPLEVTHTALATPQVLKRIFQPTNSSSGTAGVAEAAAAAVTSVSISPFKALVQLLLTFFESTYRQVAIVVG